MYKKVKYQNDTVIELMQEASLIQTLAKTALQTTKYEGANVSDNVSKNIFDLKSSMDSVLKDLQSLKTLYTDIDNKKSEMEKNIKLAERAYLAFQKEEIAKLTVVKKNYESEISQKQIETQKNENKAKAEAKQELDRKEKERNKLIRDTERDVTKAINDQERTKNSSIKQLTADLENLRKDSLREKKSKINQYNSTFDQQLREINDLKIQISKKEDQVLKIGEKINAGKTELIEDEIRLKSDLKNLKESVALKEDTINSSKLKLDQNINNAENQCDLIISEKELLTNKEIASIENDFAEFKELELEKLEKVKSKEEDKFSKLKETRATSIADLRAQQKAIMRELENKKEDEVTIAEREAKMTIETKRTQTDEDIEKFKNDFENFRKERLTNLNDQLSNSLTTLTQKMELIS